jgi:hypothetical protein
LKYADSVQAKSANDVTLPGGPARVMTSDPVKAP